MTEQAIARVVIACDPVGGNRSSIECAARLAAWLDAALHGVFVEDEALLHLAAMPFARHISASGERFETIDEQMVLHQFAAHAARVRATVEAAATAQEISWSFSVVRGPLTVATLDIHDQDLLVIEAASRPFAGTLRLDSRWLAATFESHCPILLLRDGFEAPHDVIALVQTTGDAAARLVTTAARLAAAGGRSLTLLLGDGTVDPAAARALVGSVSDKLAAACRVERIPGSSTLENAARAGCLLVIDADNAVNDPAALKDLLTRSRADILFLR